MKLSSLHRTKLGLTLHDIHGLNKKGADEGQYEGEIFEMGANGKNKSGGRDKEEDPIKSRVFLLLFHAMRVVSLTQN